MGLTVHSDVYQITCGYNILNQSVLEARTKCKDQDHDEKTKTICNLPDHVKKRVYPVLSACSRLANTNVCSIIFCKATGFMLINEIIDTANEVSLKAGIMWAYL